MDGVDAITLCNGTKNGTEDDKGRAGIHHHAQQEESDDNYNQERDLVSGDGHDGILYDISGMNQG